MSDSRVTAQRLRELLARGEVSAACDVLYSCYSRDLRRFVAFLRPAASVRDICQETWIAVLAALPRFRFETSPRVWLFSIARRKFVDVIRGRGRRPRETTLDTAELLVRGLSLMQSAPSSPLRQLQRQRRSTILTTALAGWTPDDRELLELRFVAGLKPAEIALLLADSPAPNTVSQRLVRLAKRLRAELQRHDEFRVQ